MDIKSPNNNVQLGDLHFKPFISTSEIQKRVAELGQQISTDFEGKCPLIVCILNGSFIFCSDLVRAIQIDCEVQFMKVSSYEGTTSTGNIKPIFNSLPKLDGREVILVEDIIDQGHTIDYLYRIFQESPVASLRIASLLLKPAAYKYTHTIDYLGFEIPNDFVVGYGLDYNQMGRNLPQLYTLQKD